MPNDHDKQIREVRQFAWLFLVVFLAFAAGLSWGWYADYSTRAVVRANRLSAHLGHVREIQSLPPTADSITNAAISYLRLGMGALIAVDEYQDIANWIFVVAIALCVCGILVPIKVLRSISSGQKTKGTDDFPTAGK